jgi:REP element-mobilizing transposase RayT
MKFDPQKHHRRSIRLKEYDYTQAGGYYITIVTFQREHLFGKIQNDVMQLSKFGLVAKQQWEKLPKRFPNIELGAFIIMPNHAHGIIQILDNIRRDTAEGVTGFINESSRRAPTGAIPTPRKRFDPHNCSVIQVCSCVPNQPYAWYKQRPGLAKKLLRTRDSQSRRLG